MFAWVLVISATPVLALDANQRASEYLKTTFTVNDGLPSNVVNAIVQSQSGFLWMGTDAGLARFNGRRFNLITLRGSRATPQGVVRSLAFGPDGDLWVGTDTGLVRIPSGALEQFDAAQISFYHPGSDRSDEITALHFNRDGSLWVGTNKGLYRLNAAKFQLVVPEVSISRLEEKSDGHMLMVSNRGWAELDNFKKIEHPGFNERLGAAWNEVFHVFEDRSGDLWFAGRKGLARQRGDVLEKVQPYGVEGAATFRILQDRQDNLWVFTQTGIYRATVNGLEALAPGMNAASAYADRDGNLWVGRKGDGLVRFKNRPVHVLNVLAGPGTSHPTSVLARSDGSIWVGNSCGGVSFYNGSGFTTYDEKDGLINSCVSSLAEDGDRNLWIGTYGGLFRFRDGTFTRFLPTLTVRAILPSPDGSLWIATEDGLNLMKDGHFRNFTTADGLSSNRVLNVYRDRRGTVWVGTSRGIDRLEAGRFVHVPSAPDVLGARYIGLAEDSSGTLYGLSAPRGVSRVEPTGLVTVNDDLDLISMIEHQKDIWAAGVNGIVRFPASEFGLPPEGREGALDYEQFGVPDGLPSPQVSLGVPDMATTPDGKLWVATVRGVAMIDLTKLSNHDTKPLVYVDEVVIGRTAQAAGKKLTLLPGTHHLELRFDSLELTSPEKIRFQYRFDGIDSNWLDADTTRTAVYTSIPIGAHSFHIRACNVNGIWDRTGIVYEVTQLPHFYETTLFRAATIGAALLLLVFTYHRRLKQLEIRAVERMRDRIAERERIAREIHDTLLQGIQGLILRFQANTEKLPAGDPLHARMEADLDRAEQLLMEGRDRVKDLRSSVETTRDVYRALREAGEDFARDFPGEFQATQQGDARDINPLVCEEIYRIGLEALTNAFHHSEGPQITLELNYTKARLRLRIHDNGQGITPAILEPGHRAGHWGLIGMRERAHRVGAHLALSSDPTSGTEVVLDVPARIAFIADLSSSTWRRLSQFVQNIKSRLTTPR